MGRCIRLKSIRSSNSQVLSALLRRVGVVWGFSDRYLAPLQLTRSFAGVGYVLRDGSHGLFKGSARLERECRRVWLIRWPNRLIDRVNKSSVRLLSEHQLTLCSVLGALDEGSVNETPDVMVSPQRPSGPRI